MQNINKDKRIDVSWRTPLKSKSVCCSILACFVGIFNLNYWTGYLSTVFLEKHFMDSGKFGFVIMSQQLTNVLGCMVMSISCRKMPRKFLFMISFFFLAVC